MRATTTRYVKNKTDKKRNTDRVKRPVLSAKLRLWENTSKLSGTTLRQCLLSFRSQLCLALLRCNPVAVTPISALNKYSEVLTPPCLDSQAGSPDSRAALRRTYQHRPPYRNAGSRGPFDSAADPTVTRCVCVFMFTRKSLFGSLTQHTDQTASTHTDKHCITHTRVFV